MNFLPLLVIGRVPDDELDAGDTAGADSIKRSSSLPPGAAPGLDRGPAPGFPSFPGRRALNHIEPTENKRRHAKRELLRKKYRDAGLCVQCGKPPVEGRRECRHHLDQHRDVLWRQRQREGSEVKEKSRERRRRNVQRCRESGRCTRCGNILLEYVDYGHVKCINCRERIGAI